MKDSSRKEILGTIAECEEGGEKVEEREVEEKGKYSGKKALVAAVPFVTYAKKVIREG